MAENEEVDPIALFTPSPEEITRQFNEDVAALGGQSALAHKLYKLGDRRPSTLRNIQRMAAGDTRVSGEMRVITALLLKAHRRAECQAEHARWQIVQNGCITTNVREFQISLSPESRGRWHVSLIHKDGYSHPWPSWQHSLKEAKITAMVCLEEAWDVLRVNEISRTTETAT